LIFFSFRPFPSSHELAARQAREEYLETSKYLPGATRPVPPPHFDALEPIHNYNGSYVPPRRLIRDRRWESRDDRRRDDYEYHRSRRNSRSEFTDQRNSRDRYGKRDRSDSLDYQQRHEAPDISKERNEFRSRELKKVKPKSPELDYT